MKVDKCLGDQSLVYKIGPPNRNWGAFAKNAQIIARYATKRRGQSQSCIVLARGTFGEVSRMRLFYSSAFLSRMERLLEAAVAEWLSSWLAVQVDRGSIHGLTTWIFRDWLSPAPKSRYGWKIAKSTLILKTTNHPTKEREGIRSRTTAQRTAPANNLRRHQLHWKADRNMSPEVQISGFATQV